jgi:hypothetical protein
MIARAAAGIVPVEYAVAVDRYLAEAELGPASRRVYRISLASWSWPLVGKVPPAGPDRRRASPPVVPLALTGRGRLSYRRAAEIFAEHTRPLDPDGRGWMLHQLRRRPAD